MKKSITLLFVVIVASVSALVYAGTPVNFSDLPKASQTFLNRYFPGVEIRKAEKERGVRAVEYEVDLASGAEVDFRSNGDWKEVKAAHGDSVPAGIVPAAIADYVAENFKDECVVEISRERNGYEIELSNGKELRLTEDAKPVTQRRGGRGNRR